MLEIILIDSINEFRDICEFACYMKQDKTRNLAISSNLMYLIHSLNETISISSILL